MLPLYTMKDFPFESGDTLGPQVRAHVRFACAFIVLCVLVVPFVLLNHPRSLMIIIMVGTGIAGWISAMLSSMDLDKGRVRQNRYRAYLLASPRENSA